MPILKEDVLKVAHLARIDLSGEELKLFSHQLESVLEFIDKLKTVDVSSVKPTNHVLDIQNVLRADTLRASLKKEDVLRNAPETLKEHFQVPRVIE